MENLKKAYIAGGCFWGMEDLFRVRPGVIDTEVGYIGGENDNPTYQNHPGHAEGMEITYDANTTSFKELLDYFFRMHDPTTVDRQGNDKGSSYRSAIFIQNEEEEEAAKEVIQLVDDSKKWPGKVVTTLEPISKFWVAEDYHQDYLVKKPNGYTCHFERFNTSFL
ncbi:peptide-methionine (S)-S-oxide reductase MsrA [Flavobacterium piscisymbiosum]|uniref:Peptide methionine sulfoxide reductase MsrA n=1 Tax=Flavobacterium piscisymbiosum TaxID=2893753 RepID=A0ABS8MGY3_9FLAO|nr:peptide-methionine (S)-S-oxide reductase MsrA [Flavobacterium sp. F-30]MCC9064733.1 peptide-methionine (S)-S-oxide reductase MsrA [Flavobacterium sp. F-30]